MIAIAKIGVYRDEGLWINSPTNRISVHEEKNMQTQFEAWLSSTSKPPQVSRGEPSLLK